MDENSILAQLEELAHSLAVKVRYEVLKREGTFSVGGLCRVKGEPTVIIHSKATVREKIQILAAAVNQFDLSQVYIRPGLREYLEDLSGSTPEA
jgi:hypothetical protein